jgi:uncharacterized protein (DUF362 family)
MSHPAADRRSLLVAAVGAGLGLGVWRHFSTKWPIPRDRRPQRSKVAILSAGEYDGRLEDVVLRGLQLFHLDLRGKSVLLKPNLVEWSQDAAINTHPLVVGAAVEAVRRLGAGHVIVGEGPGHQRDTQLVLTESGLDEQLRARKVDFVDLNRDELIRVPVCSGYTGMDHFWLPRSVLTADLVVSMPKVKTHHWAGVTLSMKNMFGVIPGAQYGWPKNALHWRGIHNSIVDICATVPIHFVIADGIVAMEGNGPLHGESRNLGRIVMADDPVAADFTCAQLMGLRPERVAHLATAAGFLGNGDLARQQQLAESPVEPATPFQVLPEFRSLRKM